MTTHVDSNDTALPLPHSHRGDEAARGAVGTVLEILALLAWVVGTQALGHWLGATTPAGNAVAMAGVVGSLLLVLIVHRFRGESWSTLGLVRPRSWLRTLALALVAAAVLKGIIALVGAPLVSLLGGEPPDSSRFDPLRGNLAWLLGSLPVMWITAAFIEEVVYRGFLLGRFARLLGGGRAAWVAGLVASSAVFGSIHAYQGITGVVLTGLVGFMLGVVYLLGGRNLWLAILVHGFMNTTSFVLIYLGLDS